MIKKESQLINIIVRAILIEAGKLVVVKWEKPALELPSETGILIGGRVEYGEELTEALVREVKEETGVDVKVEKLLYTHQQVFVSRRTGTEIHELGWYFLVSPINKGDEACPNDSRVSNPDLDIMFNERIPITEKDLSVIYPVFLRENLPADVATGFIQTPKTIYTNWRTNRHETWPQEWMAFEQVN
ncbi:MAG: NUDIX domain-containing protein [Chloroflexota bacterium]